MDVQSFYLSTLLVFTDFKKCRRRGELFVHIKGSFKILFK